MNIETKYNIGDSLYFMHDNEITGGTVLKCQVHGDYRGITSVMYEMSYRDCANQRKMQWVSEKELFVNTKDLLDYLIKKIT